MNQSSSQKSSYVAAACGFAAAVAIAGLAGYAAPSVLHATTSVRPAVQAVGSAAPSAPRGFITRTAVSGPLASVPEYIVSPAADSSSFQVTLPVAFGVTAIAAVLGALLGRRQNNGAISGPQPLAMAATSGERLVWFPGAKAPAHLTGEFPGDRGFDPLGLAKNPKTFERMRISEVFHGRLAMLGIVGCIVPELLFQKGAWFEAGDNVDLFRVSVAALQVIAPLEYWRGNGGFGWNGDGLDRSYPGFDPLSLTNESSKLKEIKNGRLAMIGMLGLEVQYHITGQSPLANLSAHLADPLHVNIAAGSVAMFATSGEKNRPLWFPGGYSPSYLTGEFPGDRGFDPFGLAADPKTYERMRISEVFHGRLAMLAVVGAVVPEILGKGAWYDTPDLADMGLEQLGVFAVLSGLPEYWRGQGGFSGKLKGSQKSYPGFDPLKLTSDYNKEAEIKNGRLAMTAIAGFFVQYQVTGKSPVTNFLDHWYNPLGSNIAANLASPSVAMFATSGHKDGLWFPGAKPPAYLTGEFPGDRGFDPLGLSYDADVFARMRVSEVFHGRLAMIGVLAAIVPELLGKGAWYEQDDLKVGLVVMAIAAPVEYWRGQGGFGWDKGTGDRSYPGFDPLKLTSDRNKAAEIKNGRLAMAAVAGFAVQYLVTGQSPLANVAAHVSNPIGANIIANLS